MQHTALHIIMHCGIHNVLVVDLNTSAVCWQCWHICNDAYIVCKEEGLWHSMYRAVGCDIQQNNTAAICCTEGMSRSQITMETFN